MLEPTLAPIDTRALGAALGGGGIDRFQQTVAALDTAPGASELDGLLESFQSILFNEMMKAMRAAVPESSFDEGSSQGRQTFEAMLDEEYGRLAGARTGALGLTEALKQQLLGPQALLQAAREAAPAAGPTAPHPAERR